MFMKLLAAAAIVFAASSASATVLTFDNVSDCSTSEVTITGGTGGDACVLSTFLNPTDPAIVRGGTGPTNSFWTATFNGLASGISVDLGDVNADPDRLFLSAFDAANTLLETVTLDIDDSFIGLQTLSLTATGVSSIAFGVTGDLGIGGIFADNLTFDVTAPPAVPLPAGGFLLIAGLGILAAAKRRQG